jgi:polar amino acid transport system substrate-binding protein
MVTIGKRSKRTALLTGRKAAFASSLLCASLLFLPAKAADQSILKLATSYWPPYTGEDLPGGGISTSVVRAVFARAGYEISVTVQPWQRSQTALLNDDRFIATFPVYDTTQRKAECHLSRRIGTGPIGFAERRDNPISWQKLEDLRGVRIGTVMGYTNTDKFDAMAEAGVLDVSAVPDDLMNLRRLVFNRIDLAAMDKYVMRYMVLNTKELKPHRLDLQMNQSFMRDQTFHICFPKTEAGEDLKAIFDAALNPDEVKRVIEESLRALSLDDASWEKE